MSALEELRSGQIGEHFHGLLKRTVSAVARMGLYPPPDGHKSWDRDAIGASVSDFLAHPQTRRRLTDLQTHCRTEQALRARLQRTIRNFFADNGRRTPVGRLVRRINEVLIGESGFERDGIYWRLAGTTSEPLIVDFDRLMKVVAALEVAIPTAWLTGDRNSPEIDGPSVVRIARATLEAAGGPLRPADLARLTAKRLGLGGVPLSLDAAAFEPASTGPGSADSTGSDALADIRADDVFSRLNDAERASVGLAELSVERLGEVLGVSGSKAHLIRKRAVAILHEELAGEEDGQLIADSVLEMTRIWSESWMK